ncbi:MAG: ComEC/Rec2 family competence protein [Chloroflexota bacterium]
MLLLALTIGILSGVALGLWMLPPYPQPIVVILAVVLIIAGMIVAWRNGTARWCGIALLAGILSGARAQFDLLQLTESALPVSTDSVRGTVADVPRAAGRAWLFELDVDSSLTDGHWDIETGRIAARTFGFSPAEGDRVEIVGTLRSLADQPGAPRATQLRRRRITQEMEVERLRVLRLSQADPGRFTPDAARQWMEQRIDTYLDVPQGALLAGLLFGSRSALPQEVRLQFAQTGTSHIVAVSGFNVVLVAGAASLVASRVMGVKAAAAVAIVAVTGYTMVVGAPPSAVRAACMAIGALSARIVHRPADSLSGLLVAGAGMALFEPLVVQDLGFQLSMLATGGLVLFLPSLESGAGWRRRLLGVCLTPLTAQIATLPLVLHVFHAVSFVAVLANVLVAPLVPIAMAAGSLLLLVASIDLLAIPAAWIAWLIATAILEIVRLCAALPGAWLATGAFPLWAVLCCYLAFLAWILQRSPDIARTQRARAWLQWLAPVMLIGMVVGLILSANPPQVLSGELLDDGGTVIARSPSGKMILMGTTLSPPILTGVVAERLPFWKRNIDVVMLTDGSAASWRGVQALGERYAIDALLVPRSANVPPVVGPGQILQLSDSLEIALGDGALIRVQPSAVASLSRSWGALVDLSFGSTALRILDTGDRRPMVDHAGAWIKVVREIPTPSDFEPILDGPLVRWGKQTDASERLRDFRDQHTPFSKHFHFTIDGTRITMRWSECQESPNGCAAAVYNAAVSE